MARGRVGGTKSKLRGVVGDVIYQIAKNPYGDYDQKVIEYTREKLNNNTKWQALARMQIAMFQRCMSELTPIIKCSYQGVKTGVTSVNYFVSQNMKLVQDFCIDHWKDGGGYSFPYKGREYESFGQFLISTGSYQVPSQFSFSFTRSEGRAPIFKFDLSKVGVRMYDLRKTLRFSFSDTINILLWSGMLGTRIYGMTLVQLTLNRQFGDYKVITPSNCDKVFTVNASWWAFQGTQEKQVKLNASFDQSTRVLSFQPNIYLQGLYQLIPVDVAMFTYIFSHKKGTVWERNTNIIRPPKVLDVDEEWGIHPYEAYYTWDENYDGEDYEDYF